MGKSTLITISFPLELSSNHRLFLGQSSGDRRSLESVPVYLSTRYHHIQYYEYVCPILLLFHLLSSLCDSIQSMHMQEMDVDLKRCSSIIRCLSNSRIMCHTFVSSMHVHMLVSSIRQEPSMRTSMSRPNKSSRPW